MFAYSFTAALMSLFLISAPLNQNDDKKDEEKLQGTWKMTKSVINGEEEPAERFAGKRFVIEGDTLTVWGQVEAKGRDGTSIPIPVKLKLKLDPAKNPKHIDMTSSSDNPAQEQTTRGIYELRADETLVICFPSGPDKPRPTELKSEKGSGYAVVTFTRVK